MLFYYIKTYLIKFLFFNKLSYDYLKITNENSETFGVICGRRFGTDIIVTGGYALLTFHSDFEVQKKGFNISFAVVPEPRKYKQNYILGTHIVALVKFSFKITIKEHRAAETSVTDRMAFA